MTDQQREDLARSVRHRREAAGLSRQGLAVKAGLSVSVVARLEQVTIPDPRLSTIMAIAAALGCGVDDLLTAPAEEVAPKRKRKR